MHVDAWIDVIVIVKYTSPLLVDNFLFMSQDHARVIKPSIEYGAGPFLFFSFQRVLISFMSLTGSSDHDPHPHATIDASYY